MYSANKYLVYPIVIWRSQTTTEYQVGFPIRKSMDQRVLSPPHGLSQSATSFIASYRQGIHQTPFSRLIRSSECMTCDDVARRRITWEDELGSSTIPHPRILIYFPEVWRKLSHIACAICCRLLPAPGLTGSGFDNAKPLDQCFRLGKTVFVLHVSRQPSRQETRISTRTTSCQPSPTRERRKHVSCFSL